MGSAEIFLNEVVNHVAQGPTWTAPAGNRQELPHEQYATEAPEGER